MVRKYLILYTVIATLLAAAVLAQPTNITSSEITFGANETRQDSGPAASIGIEGGNISEINISTEIQSGWWFGAWGSVSLNYTLEDATGNVFYNWGIANVSSGEVFFSNDSLVLWGETQMVNASPQNLTYAQTTHNWANSPSVDNLTNTYTLSNTHQAFGITGGESFAADSTPAVNIFSGTDGLTFNSTMLWQNASHPLGSGERMDYPVFASLIDTGLSSFKANGLEADYQVLLPTRGSGNVETYFVYVELT